ncbi:MAG: M23 family metallopeptidase [Mangrovibacterium sp.]
MKKKGKGQNREKIIRKLSNRYRLMIYDDNTFQAVWSMRMTRVKVLQWVLLAIIPLIGITTFLIFFTPIRQLVPGYPEAGMRKNLIQNAALVDSLRYELELQKNFLESIQAIIHGDVPEEKAMLDIDSTLLVGNELSEYNFDHDSIFQLHLLGNQQLPKEVNTANDEQQNINDLAFFRPIEGIITDQYDASIQHFGIDLTSSPEATINATLDGTVIFAGYTIETGYIMYIQHNHNLVSVYKHNLNLLKKTGETVKAGEAIAIMGNTGKLTTGPHLHFELWYKGQPINPANYINFNSNIN